MSVLQETSRAARPASQSIAQAGAPSLEQCEQLLILEARLLDEGRFDEWLGLFTADAWYWVPAEPGQASPRDTISLIYDDRRLLETRVRRLASPRIYSQEPRSRTSRIIANVTMEESASDAATVRSKFQLLEYRRETQRLFGGTCLHHLVRGANGIQIAWKRVDLVNCDAPHEGLVVPF
jgi:3-phenylpropionate/cinnamic acid dioxygenase small subunit